MRFLLPILLFFAFGVNAQNLIPNPSFESGASGNLGDGYYGAEEWNLATLGTVDYWTIGEQDLSCYAIPINSESWINYGEWVIPFEGERMMGAYTWHSMWCLREILQCRLIEPLQAEQEYCFSMWVQRSNMYDAATDGLGIAVSQDSLVDFMSTCGVGLDAVVESTPGIAVLDTTNWVRVEGSFIAEGGEEFLYLGNLRDDMDVTAQFADGTLELEVAYYYFDDLSLVSCGVNVQEETRQEVNWWPNPASETLHFSALCDWQIFDLNGRMILNGYSRSVAIAELASGVYLVKIGDRYDRLVVQ